MESVRNIDERYTDPSILHAHPEMFPTSLTSLWNPKTDDDYFGARYVSHHSLEVFRKSVPNYHRRFVLGEAAEDQDKAYFDIGKAFHCLLLEPERFDDKVTICPEELRRTWKEEGRKLEAYRAKTGPYKAILTPAEWKQVSDMAEACMRNPAVADLLGPKGYVEQPFRWIDRTTGLALKGRTDKVSDEAIIDIKTATYIDLESFGRSVVNYGYHRQAAMYAVGVFNPAVRPLFEVNGVCPIVPRRRRYVFVVVGKTEPYESVVYELDPAALKLGDRQNEADLNRLADCYRRDRWESYYSGKTLTLTLPPWAYR